MTSSDLHGNSETEVFDVGNDLKPITALLWHLARNSRTARPNHEEAMAQGRQRQPEGSAQGRPEQIHPGGAWRSQHQAHETGNLP